MWERLFGQMLDRIIRKGRMEVTLPSGRVISAGEAGVKPIRVTIRDRKALRAILTRPDLGLGEGYMNGTITIEGDDLRGLMWAALDNMRDAKPFWLQRPADMLGEAMRGLAQHNTRRRARRNVAHHYDLSSDLYELFLDADRQYSCAYFRHPGDSLDRAQAQKKAHIAGKLLLKPGMKVLDIGCGWGGMALTLARDYGARVVGVTLSTEQHEWATARAAREGLSDRVEFRIQDYREVDETFDRIVSVGMFEHVGAPYYREYFSHVRRMLTEDGVALIHSIGRHGPPGATGAFIDRYIFPGGYIPAMSEATAAIEKEGLWMTDIEVLRLHYAETLRNWYDRFMANIDKARALYDERFCRMWRFYLVASEMGFRAGMQGVFQFQLARRQESVPLTRDYLYAPAVEDMRHHRQSAAAGR